MLIGLLGVQLMVEHFVESTLEIQSRIAAHHFGDVGGFELRVGNTRDVVSQAKLHQAAGIIPEEVHVPSVERDAMQPLDVTFSMA